MFVGACRQSNSIYGFFMGAIDDVILFSEQLDSFDMYQVMHVGVPSNCGSVLLYYGMNDLDGVMDSGPLHVSGRFQISGRSHR